MLIILIVTIAILILACVFVFWMRISLSRVIKDLRTSEELLKQENKSLRYRLDHDPITGHTNWLCMFDQIGHSPEERILPYTLVHFDLKEFKMFNELYDHKVGNLVLCFVSEYIRKADFILASARCHNDNFAFMVKPEYDENLRETLEKFFEGMKYVPGYEERPLYFRCGVVEKNISGIARDTIADMAKMAQSLGTKKNCTEIIFYDETMKEDLLKGEKLLNDLPEAFMRDEILVYLQPKIDPKNGGIVGAEALARWNYHGREIWTPNRFIPYIEKNNGINMLDEYIVERVCRLFTYWNDQKMPVHPISINLSQREIYKESLVDDLVSIVDRYKIDHDLIEFELTETAAYEDKEYLISVMKRLKEAGFRLSMDDFGTGYSSFNLLKDMPLNTLKIDKSFIDSIGVNASDSKGQSIVEDIVRMVKHLSMMSVAEGVEDESQRDILMKCGCDYIQGYFYSKPLTVEEFEKKYLTI